jgi:hypothetical protein
VKILLSGVQMAVPDLSFFTVKKIRKMLKNGVEVPQVCKEFNIDPAEWREVSLKYSFFK